jgi:SAM-dependent methyltransferase
VIQNSDEGLVSPSDIADIAGVSRGAVSNWRKRDGSFPQPTAGSATKPLFSLSDVTGWLEATGKHTTAHRVEEPRAAAMEVWAALNLLRGSLPAEEIVELVLTVATSRTDGGHVDFDDERIPADILERVVHVIEKTDRTDLGEIADFALERLARSQGKMGADLGFVGSRTTTLLANLASRLHGGVLYDPACGIAAALLDAVKLGARPARIVGHDINPRALRIASQRAELRGVELDLALTDVLAGDIDPTLRADVIVLEPPFGVRLEGTARLTDARFDFGAPPRSSADTAWLQHAIAHLADAGRAYVLSPAGTLFRSGEEGRIRAELVKHGCVEAIVGLPGKLLPHTSIPLALWVLRRPVPEAAIESVLFIDAAETVAPEHNVATWLTDAHARESVPHVVVAITDVLAAESLLTPQRWVDRTEREPSDVSAAYRQGWSAITDTMMKLQNVLKSFEHLATFSKSRVMTVSELVDQGVLDMRMGRPKDRYEDAPEELRERIATASDVRDGTLRELGIDTEYDGYPELTWEGDVLVTTMNTIRARVDEAGAHLPATGVYRLRVLDREVLSPGYLAIALSGSWNDRFQGGTTIQRASIKDLEVPLVPLTEQRDIQLAVLSIRLLHEHSAHLAEEASTVGTALLDAVRYNARLANPDISLGTTDQDGLNDSEGAK